MKQAKKKVSITLDADLVERLKMLAENDERTLSRYVNVLLKSHVGVGAEEGGTISRRT